MTISPIWLHLAAEALAPAGARLAGTKQAGNRQGTGREQAGNRQAGRQAGNRQAGKQGTIGTTTHELKSTGPGCPNPSDSPRHHKYFHSHTPVTLTGRRIYNTVPGLAK